MANPYWDDFSVSEQQKYLQSGEVNETARLVYEGLFSPSDDYATFDMFDEICQRRNSDIANAFNIMLYFRILEKSDAALSEGMSEYSAKILDSNPLLVLEYLRLNPDKTERFASSVGYAFDVDNQYDMLEYEKLKNKIQSLDTTSEMQDFIKLFLEEVEANFLGLY
ncbi:MAG: hypothetical protein K2M07_03450 [Muribaculaceae bacterium]|nr:hypothetical protein [Muribaculaceae bacterium]